MESPNSPPPPIAYHGGTPEYPEGPPRWPIENSEVRDALHDVYESGDWGRYDGPRLASLAEAVQELIGVNYAIACSSGTVAVELALRGLKVQPGAEVILAGYDFAGNFRAIHAVGARPVLVDLQPHSWQIDAGEVEQAISSETVAILASHLHGGSAPMSELRAMADRRGLALVEDACQNVGAVVEGRRAGAWGDVATLSFGGSKLLTAGRGGMVLTNRDDVRQRIVIASQEGNNAYPLSELQAAVLLPQLDRLEADNQTRLSRFCQLAARLPQSLHPVSPRASEQDRSAGFRWGMLLNERIPVSREVVSSALRAEGIAMDPGFRGFAGRSQARCRKVGELTSSRQAARRTLLLHHSHLLASAPEIDRLGRALTRVLDALAAS